MTLREVRVSVPSLLIPNTLPSLGVSSSTSYSSSISEGYELVGYKRGASGGWIKKLGWDPKYPYVEVPVEVGGNDSAGYGDYYYATGDNAIKNYFVAGSMANGTQGGLNLTSFTYDPGRGNNYMNFSSRLAKTPF